MNLEKTDFMDFEVLTPELSDAMKRAIEMVNYYY